MQNNLLPRYVTTRTNTKFFWYRRIVPKQFQAVVGCSEITFSLATMNVEAMGYRANMATTCIDKLFLELEKLFAEALISADSLSEYKARIQEHLAMIKSSLALRNLDEKDIILLTTELRQAELQRFDRELKAEWPEVSFLDSLATKEMKAQQTQAAIHQALEFYKNRLTSLKKTAFPPGYESYLAERNICEWRSDDALVRRYRLGIVQVLSEVSTKVISHLEQIEIYEEITYQPILEGYKGWDELLSLWKEMRTPARKTYSETQSNINEWRVFTGNILPSFITKAHINAWMEHLATQEKLKPNSIKRKVGLIRAVFNMALELGVIQLELSPFERTKVKGMSDRSKRIMRLPFQEEHLQTLFTSPLFQKNKQSTMFWVFLIGLVSGARLEEIAQLSLGDIKQRGGRLWFSFNDYENDRQVKNEGSCREVPVHNELLRIGFKQYVQALHAKGETRLFPDLKKTTHGSYSKVLSNKLGRYIDEHVVDEKRFTFHSLRHNFRDFAVNSDVRQDVSNLLTGHVLVGMEARYGQKNHNGRRVFSDRVLLKSMDKLDFGSLDLSHLYQISEQDSFSDLDSSCAIAA